MRKILIASAAAAIALSAAPAFAQTKTSNTQVTAFLANDCEITSGGQTLTLGAVNTSVPGVFTYTCNFVGSPTLTFQSTNGGVKTTDNGGALRNYGIYLNDSPPTGSPSSWRQASEAQGGGFSYSNITASGSPNTTVSPSFAVGLSEALTVAGNYSDTLTITIAP